VPHVPLPPPYVSLVTVSIGLAGFVFGLYQYLRNQRWRRAQAAAELLDRFFSDPQVNLAIKLLSWTKRTFTLPRNAFNTATFDNNDGGEIEHSMQKLAIAFSLQNRVHYKESNTTDLKPEFLTNDIVIYVEIFDDFFEKLSRTLHFIKCYKLEITDLAPMIHLIRRIAEVEYNGKSVFRDYLEYYEYEDILDVLRDKKIQRAIPEGRRVDQA
jgi:hypothetical protein